MKRTDWPEQKKWDATILAALDAEPKRKQACRIDTRHGKVVVKENIPRYEFEEGLPPKECPSFDEAAGLIVPMALPSPFRAVVNKHFRKHRVMTDGLVDALKIIYAVVLSTYYRDDVPLWMDIVGAPSTGKTMLLSCIKDVPEVLFKSRITPAAFVSGDRSVKKDPSILGKLNGCCLTWKDFTEFLSQHIEDKERFNAALRGAYDGHSHTDFGNGVVRDYPDIYFTMLTGVTNNIYLDSSVSLGERRLKFKLPRTVMEDEKTKIRKILANQQDSSEASAGLRRVSKWFIQETHKQYTTLPEVPERIIEKITAFAMLGGRLRTHVDREKYDATHQIQIQPENEEGIRYAKQLQKLAQCLAMVDWRDEVSEYDLHLIKKVVLSSPHPFISETFCALESMNGELVRTRTNLCAKTNIPNTTMGRILRDLNLIGVVYRESNGGKLKGEIGGKSSDIWKLRAGISELCAESRF